MVDVALVIALEEEFEALDALVGDRWTPEQDPTSHRYFYRFNQAGPHTTTSCVAVLMGGMGPTLSATVSAELIRRYRPGLIVNVGIAGGLSNDVRLGDVVVADEISEYLANAKAIEKGKGFELKRGGANYRADHPLITLTKNLRFAHRARFKAWRENCRGRRQSLIGADKAEELQSDGQLSAESQCRVGPLASGSVVAGSPSFVDWIKGGNRKFLAVEMEAAGMVAAAFEAGVRTLVLRGISDLADGDKSKLDKIGDGALRKLAMGNALDLLWELMAAAQKARPVNTPDQTRTEGAKDTTIFAWAHISDLHFGHGDARHGHDQALVLQELQADLSRAADRDAPELDAIFVTGDIAFSAKRKEYEEAGDWLEETAERVGLDSRDIFAVPGNHDIPRISGRSKGLRRLVYGIRGPDPEETLDSALDDKQDCKALVKRLSKFEDFALDLAKVDRDEHLSWFERYELDDGSTLRIVGLNTAILANDAGDKGQLQLGAGQIASALNDPAPEDDELVVVLGHHPLQDTWLSDQEYTLRELKKRANVYLCGHVHVQNADVGRTSGGRRPFITVIAGASHGDRVVPGGKPDHSYNIAALVRRADDKIVLRLWPRRWSDKHREFRVDVGNVPDGEVYEDLVLRK